MQNAFPAARPIRERHSNPQRRIIAVSVTLMNSERLFEYGMLFENRMVCFEVIRMEIVYEFDFDDILRLLFCGNII